ncbi:hypothetical protein [Marinisporobacter balticus]|uniref:Uncharacterized protein n=1 Tax=Marinisporobacter balticus TaxID=2018667 RepID=A0A4R2L524_9FIRM|nr:hypothetical protein [Marinisporobacter balticus]TCO78956.1 hypothetical protein EV214_1035 [Marinisporobacter balticus]
MRFFGPNQADIWKLLSEDIDGEWIVLGGTSKEYKVGKKFKEWSITLETASSGNKQDPVLTRIYADFFNKHGLRFKIFNEHFRNYFMSFFDMQDVQVDQNGFNKEFIIRSNSEIAMKRFFDNPMIRELINMQQDVLFEINGKGYDQAVEKDSICMVEIKMPGVIKNNEFLKNSFELMVASLLEIEKLNNEYETLDVNNFSKFSVVKKSIKNVMAEKVSYEELKESILNKISKKKKPSKDEENVAVIAIDSAMSSKQEKEDAILCIEKNINVEADQAQEEYEPILQIQKEYNDREEDISSIENTTDLNEYLKGLSVFNLDSSGSEYDNPSEKNK